jgi:hypothetical protein
MGAGRSRILHIQNNGITTTATTTTPKGGTQIGHSNTNNCNGNNQPIRPNIHNNNIVNAVKHNQQVRFQSPSQQQQQQQHQHQQQHQQQKSQKIYVPQPYPVPVKVPVPKPVSLITF